jgi:hypothetical protein
MGAKQMCWFPAGLWLIAATLSGGAVHTRLVSAATYHVNAAAATAADTNPGTEAAPWKTLSRAAAAAELRPRDTVLIHSGVYREHVELTIYMGCPEYGPYQRTVTSNHAGYNVYANTGWTPTLRFDEDLHSSLVPVQYELYGMRFELKPSAGLAALAPLPDEIRSLLPPLTFAGCRRAQWPSPER